MISFLLLWFVCYCLIILSMCLDNLTWIPTSPEWLSIHNNFFVLILFGRQWIFPKNFEGLKYCKSRVIEVIKHPYDIVPGLISSCVLAWFITKFING